MAAKAAIIGFTRALAWEAAPKGVRVNAIAPGPIDTDLTATMAAGGPPAFNDALPVQRFGRPEEIAATALLLAGPDGGFYVGADAVTERRGRHVLRRYRRRRTARGFEVAVPSLSHGTVARDGVSDFVTSSAAHRASRARNTGLLLVTISLMMARSGGGNFAPGGMPWSCRIAAERSG